MASIRRLLFVDANIWLDFYRARTEAGLGLLSHLESVSEHIVVTYQLEMEVKKNRQAAILEGMQELKAPQRVLRPGLFSDAKAVRVIATSHSRIDQSTRTLRRRLKATLVKPAETDPVYQACQRIFHKTDEIVLLRSDDRRKQFVRRAFRRFLLGCPPRKRGDTSIGDALNWEWMVDCAIRLIAPFGRKQSWL